MKTIPSILWIVAALSASVATVGAELITYSHDSAGRLTAVNYGFGRSTSYQFDAAGNPVRTTDAVLTDSDNDGMDDDWEMTHFMTLARNGTEDYDSDGLTDLEEFLAGTLPKDDQSVLRINRNVTATQVSTTIEWKSVPGKTYRVQYKDSLADPGWNDLPGDVTATGGIASKIDSTSPGSAHRYYRVQVVP